MISFFGDYDTTETVNLPFNTFSSNDPAASVTITDLAAADVEIHKDGSVTQRASDAGVTVSIDFDGVTGNHIVHIDLSDNTDAGFYAAGARYQVRIEGTTVDGGTLNVWIGSFSIGCTLRPTTSGRTLDVNAAGEAGLDFDNTSGTLDTADFAADFLTDALIANGAFVAANFAANSLDSKGDWNTVVPDAAGVAPTATEVVDEWETQAAASPTGFKVNVMEVNGTGQTANDNGADINAILVDTNELQTDWANDGRLDVILDARSSQGTVDAIDLVVDDILVDTAEIGAAGVGLSAVPWNASWDAEVQSECNDALVVLKLDHLVAVADADDAVDDSIIAKMSASDGDWSGFDNATESLEAIRDRGDADWSAGAAANPNLLLEAEIAVVTDQTHFTLATGSDQDDAYNDQAIVLYDDTNSDYPCTRTILDYVGATKTVTVNAAAVFTLADDDSVKIFVTAPGSTPPSAAEIVDEWETQSQADPTGFHVNLQEVKGQAITCAAGVTILASVGAATVQPTNAQLTARTRLDADYFSWGSDAVANVTLVATTTTNTDMRGTDGANTTVPDAAGVAPTQAEITGGAYSLDTDASGRIRIVDGTGVGEINTASGRVDADVRYWAGGEIKQYLIHATYGAVPGVDTTAIHGTALTETAGQLAGRFVDFFDQDTATFNVKTALADFKATGFATPTNITAGTITTVTTVTNAVVTDAASRTASKADVSALATSAELADGTVEVGNVQDGAIGADAVEDIFSTTAIVEAYAADAAAGTPAQVLYMIQQALTEFAISSTTLTVKKLDGSTAAATYTLDSDTAPTSRTRAT